MSVHENSGHDTVADEISLMDILVTLAESWKLLVAIPLLASVAAAVTLWFVEAREYRSVALLRITAAQAAMLQTARVLDTPLRQSGWVERYGPTLSSARERMIEKMTVTPVTDGGFYRVTLVDETAESAQSTLSSIVASLILLSVPTEEDRQVAEMQLEGHRQALAELQSHLGKIGNTYENGSVTSHGDIGQSVVTLLADIDRRRQSILDIELSLVSSVKQADILQRPSLPDRALSRNIATRTILIGVAAGFVVLIFVFIRQGWRNASSDPAGAEKVARVRRAFGLKENVD